MTITKTEVKTFYSIEINIDDFSAIFNHFDESMKKHHYPHAFEFAYDNKGSKIKDVEEVFTRKLWEQGNSDTYRYIANYYGFDGWQNAGYYNEGRKVYHMQMYNEGSTL